MLIVEKLSAGYGRSDVLQGVDLVVPSGKLVCIVGGNGAGKSTAMRAISGMLAPTSGRVQFRNVDVTSMPSHKMAALGMAHAPEGRRVFSSLSVQDNLRLGAFRRARADRRRLAEDFDRIFSWFPRLSERRAQAAGTLSGGEQQMLAIGRALMSNPDLILLDEPSMGLAPKLVEDVYRIIIRLREEGRTILLVEQFANLALAVADYAYVMENGRIALSGTGQGLLRDGKVKEAYIGGGGYE
ncbi:ABC transporter ATP-binding protein [Ensifer sp.]|jgi:branched-chain amino acid transport system ATP-binding protein|uniref:ABC transporter ATP-binding protein n=1 Tax=Ensifer sp. TaxID=1872086 RepID=UPI002E14640F|nr:ABC transporter ATP-binding protein [Ensifer sp.]